jgi:hypothetical protein
MSVILLLNWLVGLSAAFANIFSKDLAKLLAILADFA